MSTYPQRHVDDALEALSMSASMRDSMLDAAPPAPTTTSTVQRDRPWTDTQCHTDSNIDGAVQAQRLAAATEAPGLVVWVRRLVADKCRRSGIPSSDLYPIFHRIPGDQHGRELVRWFARDRGSLPIDERDDMTWPPSRPTPSLVLDDRD